MRSLWLDSTHPLEYRARSTTFIGSIIPTQGESYKFVPIYFISDKDSEVATRSAIVDGLQPDIIRGINRLLHEDNHYVEMFKVAKEIVEEEDTPTD